MSRSQSSRSSVQVQESQKDRLKREKNHHHIFNSWNINCFQLYWQLEVLEHSLITDSGKWSSVLNSQRTSESQLTPVLLDWYGEKSPPRRGDAPAQGHPPPPRAGGWAVLQPLVSILLVSFTQFCKTGLHLTSFCILPSTFRRVHFGLSVNIVMT